VLTVCAVVLAGLVLRLGGGRALYARAAA
jgi:hypothetical protein